MQFIAPTVLDADLAEIPEQDRHAALADEWHGVAQDDGLVHKHKRTIVPAGNQISIQAQTAAKFIERNGVHQEHRVLPI